MKAAQEAETGAWLQELISGSLHRTLPPGLDRGAFGAWQQAEDGGSEGRCSFNQALDWSGQREHASQLPPGLPPKGRGCQQAKEGST